MNYYWGYSEHFANEITKNNVSSSLDEQLQEVYKSFEKYFENGLHKLEDGE